MDAYQEVLNEARAALKEGYQAQDGKDGWTIVDTVKDVTLMKAPSFRGVERDCYRSSAVFHAPLYFALNFLADNNLRKDYDPMCDKIEELEVFDPATKLMHRINLSPNSWIITPRDFSLIRRIEQWDEGEAVIMIKSCANSNCPEVKGYVRGLQIVNGQILKDLNTTPPSCQFTMLTQFDPQGSIPEAIIKRMGGRVFGMVDTIRGKIENLYKQEMQKKSNGEKAEIDDNALALMEEIKKTKDQ